jgi:hypothetical protein
VEPACPFCRTAISRPTEVRISASESVLGGTCKGCGAIYLVDPTSKNVGEVMMQALEMAASLAAKSSAEMVPGEDYEDAVLSYDWRRHRSSGTPKTPMDGYGRLYIIKVNKGKD